MIREANLHWRHEDTDSGLIMPWYTLPCLQWLKAQDTKDWNVFEYGAGYSTIWWRLNCMSVHSVDNVESWAEAILVALETEKLEYIGLIEHQSQLFLLDAATHESDPSPYDCVVVDGSWRIECVEYSRKFIAVGGYLIFDNYNQEGFEDKVAIDTLLEGWEKQVFKQPNHTDWCTAVFRKP